MINCGWGAGRAGTPNRSLTACGSAPWSWCAPGACAVDQVAPQAQTRARRVQERDHPAFTEAPPEQPLTHVEQDAHAFVQRVHRRESRAWPWQCMVSRSSLPGTRDLLPWALPRCYVGHDCRTPAHNPCMAPQVSQGFFN